MATITDEVLEIADALIGCDAMYRTAELANRERLVGREITRVACLSCGCVCRAWGVVEAGEAVECQCCGSRVVAVEENDPNELPGSRIQQMIDNFSKMRRCPKCRWRSSPDARYCGGCGIKLDEEPT